MSSEKGRKKKSRRTGRRKTAARDFRGVVLQANTRQGLAGGSGGRRAWFAAGLACLAVLAFVLVCLGVRFLGGMLFSGNDRFALASYRINTSGDVIKPDYVVECAGLDSCSNVFALQIGKIRREFLDDMPRVKDVEISRRLPNSVVIRVSERLPVASVAMSGYELAVDETGRVLGPASLESLPMALGHGMPRLAPGDNLRGTRVMDALRIIEACGKLDSCKGIRIETMDIGPDEHIELRLAGGAWVKLKWEGMGEEGPAAMESLEDRLSRLARSMRRAEMNGQRIVWIDLRLKHNVPCKLESVDGHP